MLFWTIVKVAINCLMANKVRSLLSMLGIIIGVAAVISMLALGSGAQKQILDRVTAMGADLLIIRPGQAGQRGVMTGTAETLTLEDAEAVLSKVPDIEMLSPVVQGNAQLKYANQNTRTNVMGAGTTYFPLRNYVIEKGRTFAEGEEERMARVAVLGPQTVVNLFGETDPLGKKFKINGMNFEVIGVLKSKGDMGWHNPDDQAIIPYTTAMKQLLGVDSLREIDVQMADRADYEKVQAAAEEVLRKEHRLLPDQDSDFHIRNMAEMAETATSVSRTFTVLLGSVAAISLLVGGIGIMNIMLVTVTERTREIGIRKAIGAKDRDVLVQFLLEALIMSGLGGVIGIAVGIGGAMGIARFSQFQTVVEVYSVLVAFFFAAAVGIFFGFYPARRAAALDPIEALRYE
jgi:putative ABC transport system permease protein